MWGVAISWANCHIGIDWSRGSDCTAVVISRHEDGKLYIESVDVLEPPHAPLEMRLVPGSDPPRYEPI